MLSSAFLDGWKYIASQFIPFWFEGNCLLQDITISEIYSEHKGMRMLVE
jgi:hypothetical protein